MSMTEDEVEFLARLEAKWMGTAYDINGRPHTMVVNAAVARVLEIIRSQEAELERLRLPSVIGVGMQR